MIDQVSKIQCTGCRACITICPVKAIRAKADQEGFCYMVIDYDKCIGCNKCENVCPALLKADRSLREKSYPEIYAARSRSFTTRKKSTSGGIFSELSLEIFRKGGCVVGAAYQNDFTVKHFLIQGPEELRKLRQSKYVQSNMASTYKEAREKLEQDKMVLFCGTPCQIDGLYHYLGKDWDKLYTCDFICRGVISPKVYKGYLDMLRKEYGSPIRTVWFKNKTKGWNDFHTYIQFENKKIYLKNRTDDLYMRGYLKYNLYLRPCCYHCRYKDIPRVADITLGDFWGIEKCNPDFRDNMGTSVVMINSEKGKQLFEDIKEKVEFARESLEDVEKGNAHLREVIYQKGNRKLFFNILPRAGFRMALFLATCLEEITAFFKR